MYVVWSFHFTVNIEYFTLTVIEYFLFQEGFVILTKWTYDMLIKSFNCTFRIKNNQVQSVNHFQSVYLFLQPVHWLTDWLIDWMKKSINCSKCQSSSVIEGCVQEMLDPSLTTSCCKQTSATHRHVLGYPPHLLSRPDASPCLPATDSRTSCSGSFLHPSLRTGSLCVCFCCLLPVMTAGLVLAAKSRCERRASRACFVKSNWQFAIPAPPPPQPLPHRSPFLPPHPSTPLWSCCLRLCRYLKSIFLANEQFFPLFLSLSL